MCLRHTFNVTPSSSWIFVLILTKRKLNCHVRTLKCNLYLYGSVLNLLIKLNFEAKYLHTQMCILDVSAIEKSHVILQSKSNGPIQNSHIFLLYLTLRLSFHDLMRLKCQDKTCLLLFTMVSQIISSIQEQVPFLLLLKQDIIWNENS